MGKLSRDTGKVLGLHFGKRNKSAPNEGDFPKGPDKTGLWHQYPEQTGFPRFVLLRRLSLLLLLKDFV